MSGIGYIVTDANDQKGVISDKGDEIIKPGTYETLEAVDEMLYATKKDEVKKEKKEDIYCNYYKYNGHSFEIRAIKEGNIKYSFIPQDIDELYDLSTDPNEMINLSDDYLCDILDFLPEAGTIGKPEYPALSGMRTPIDG